MVFLSEWGNASLVFDTKGVYSPRISPAKDKTVLVFDLKGETQ